MWQFEHSLALRFFGIGMKTDLNDSLVYKNAYLSVRECPGVASVSKHWILLELL